MARTRLRIIIPLLQVLILILAFSLDPLLSKHYVTRSDLEVAYVATPEHLALKLNFPLAVLELPVIYASLAFSSGGPSTGTLGEVLFGIYFFVIVMSTAAFWYLVVREAEMRMRKASCLRFSGRLAERLKATVMILMGVGAAVFALWDGHGLIVRSRINSLHWSSLADALIGGLFLFAWAATLITIGVQDIVRVSGSR
jgi:hypothetical protein